MIAYRPEVDGLRALAVLSVILFHAGFEGMSGGYVGVDIFFVISGYLITAIIAKEVSRGEFSIVNFWERRVRRILPALFFVLIFTVVGAWYILLPGELDSFFDSLVAVSFSVSNLFFWKTSGYFDSASELKPLLHTWSLAVEEQFYLGFPALLLLIWKFGRRVILGVVVAIAILSLLTAQYGSTSHPDATFYLIPTRAWELMIGALVALHLVTSPNREPHSFVAEASSLIGLIALISSIIWLDETIPFPSVYGLMPTVGTALIILYATPENFVGRLLANRAFVGIGLLSYSAYLWHQPLFTFARHLSVGEASEYLLLGLGVLSFLFAYFSWRFIERPFRQKGRFSRRQVFSFGLLGTVIFVIIGVSGSGMNGAPERFGGAERKVIEFSSEVYTEKLYNEGYRMRLCFLEPQQEGSAFADECLSYSVPFLWGDSHAAALSSGFRYGSISQYTASGCPPLLGQSFLGRPNCKAANEYILKQLLGSETDKLILHANWSMYTDELVESGLESTIDAVKSERPDLQIILLGGVPQWGLTGLPTRLVRLSQAESLNIAADLMIEADMEIVHERDRTLSAIALHHEGVSYQSVSEALCSLGKGCLATLPSAGPNPGFIPTAWDYGHLTEEGARHVVEMLAGSLLGEAK